MQLSRAKPGNPASDNIYQTVVRLTLHTTVSAKDEERMETKEKSMMR